MSREQPTRDEASKMDLLNLLNTFLSTPDADDKALTLEMYSRLQRLYAIAHDTDEVISVSAYLQQVLDRLEDRGADMENVAAVVWLRDLLEVVLMIHNKGKS